MEPEKVRKDGAAVPKSHYLNKKTGIMFPVLLIMLAELLLLIGKPVFAVWLHVLVLIGLSTATVYFRETDIYMSYQALMLLPLLRLINISMPIFFEMTLYSYIFIYSPLIIPVYIIAVHQKFTSAQLGLTLRNLKYFLPAAIVVGLAIAEGEYYIIRPGYLIPDLSIINLVRLSIVMILFIGVVEELIFRSVLQTRLEETTGMFSGLVIASVLFGMMHSGYGTFYEMLFTSFAGFTMGYLFQRTRSLPLIAMIHGMVNIFLFGLIPHLGPALGLF